jgi:cytidine deaminase
MIAFQTLIIDNNTLNNMIKYRRKQIIKFNGYYQHVAMIYKKNDMFNPLSYGTNYYTCSNDNTIHAEHDALIRLRGNKKTTKKINIIVIRYTATYKLSNSKPCIFCLENMYNIAKSKGYTIHKIYYSNNNNIEVEKFIDLYNDINKHIPKKFRHKDKISKN